MICGRGCEEKMKDVISQTDNVHFILTYHGGCLPFVSWKTLKAIWFQQRSFKGVPATGVKAGKPQVSCRQFDKKCQFRFNGKITSAGRNIACGRFTVQACRSFSVLERRGVHCLLSEKKTEWTQMAPYPLYGVALETKATMDEKFWPQHHAYQSRDVTGSVDLDEKRTLWILKDSKVLCFGYHNKDRRPTE